MNRRLFLGGAAGSLASTVFLPRLAAQTANAFPPQAFFFKDGDRVVMIGDSITEQLLHSNYVESFVVSRFPQWKIAFRNVGIGGDTSTGGNGRTTRDILSFKPTATTITFGMNDGGYRVPHDPARLSAYRTGLEGMAAQLKAAGVRTAILSSSPVEKKEDGPALDGYNRTLQTFAATAKEVAQKNGFVFVDQFHPHVEVLDLARSTDPKLRINGGDPVHPGPSGQLLMAWAILKGLGAPSLVSQGHIHYGAGLVGSHLNCVSTSIKQRPNGLSFVRSDEIIPFWMPPASRSILKWAPIVEDLNQYLLRITGLPEGAYTLTIDGEKCATITAAELDRGYNMALIEEGPIARQAQAVSDAVFAKNRYYHDAIFRGVVLNNQVPAARKTAEIEERMKGMPAREAAIREALELRPHRFDLTKA